MLELLGFILVVALLSGLILWGIANAPWIDATIKPFLRVLIIVIVGVWIVLRVAGFFGIDVGSLGSRQRAELNSGAACIS